MSPLLPILGKRGAVADRLADAIVLLMRAAADRESPHELEDVDVIGLDGAPHTVKRFPSAWSRRLVRAVETGAFRRKPPEDIVAVILTTEEPA